MGRRCAIAFAMIFGDLEGFAEVVLGTGSTILQQRFSQGMEKEADEFALQHMKQHGKRGTGVGCNFHQGRKGT